MEITAIKKYSNVISLGYICNVYALLTQINKVQAKQHKVFDNIATPMWAVYDLFNTDFADFFKQENLVEKTLFENSDKKYWVDTKFYTRFIALPNYDAMQKRMQTQIENLLKALQTESGEILFIRYEELNNYSGDGNRIAFPEYAEKYSKPELEYCVLLSDLLKAKYPNLACKILLLSNQENFVDTEHGIIGIKSPIVDYRDRNVSQQMFNLIKSHEDFLNTNL